jgi:hypothetical protein
MFGTYRNDSSAIQQSSFVDGRLGDNGSDPGEYNGHYRTLEGVENGTNAQFPRPNSPMRLRVHAITHGERQPLGRAVSKDTLLALIELGYLMADEVEVTGTIDGIEVDNIIPIQDFPEFRTAVA